jgi:DNA-binding response OmpR family regulator
MDYNFLLLVEDDINVQASNKRILQRRGYNLRQAYTLAEAREIICEETPGAIVLDINLPDGNGLDFLCELRQSAFKHSANIPVLVLTAMDTKDDIIRGIGAGGDDYLTKPYDLDVFVAHVEALLRRATQVPKTLTKGSILLDIISGRAIVDNNDLLLAPKEFACLLVFAQNEGEAMSTKAIYENIWKQPLEGNLNTLKTTISNLRKKIEPSGYTISAIRGKGYMFERR